MTTLTAHLAPQAEPSTQCNSVGSPADGRHAMPGGATPSRCPARNRRDRLSRLLPLALIATAAAGGCGGNATPPAGAARAGTQVFAQAGCGGCHILAAADARGQVGPNLDDLRPDYAQVASQVRDGGTGMPAFTDRLTDREIQSVAAYVAEVAGRR